MRDPVAELYAARARGRSPATLLVPVTAPFQPDTTYWLSLGQYLTLAWLRRRMRHHRGETTLVRIAEGTDASGAGVVSRRLDRLAQLSLIGRRSTRGRTGVTRFWPPRRARVLAEARRRAIRTGNVATSTPVRGFISREGIARALRGSSGVPVRGSPSGGPPVVPPERPGGRGRPRRPPRLVQIRCPLDGGAVRLTRTFLSEAPWRHQPGPARIRAAWSGRCRRCHALVVAPLDVAGIPPRDRGRPEQVGRIWPPDAGRFSAATPRPAPELVALAAEVLDSGELRVAVQRERIRAAYLPDRPPEPSGFEGPPLPRRDVLPVLVASRPADTPRVVELARGWAAGEVDLDALAPAGYGPGRAWFDVSRAVPSRPPGGTEGEGIHRDRPATHRKEAT